MAAGCAGEGACDKSEDIIDVMIPDGASTATVDDQPVTVAPDRGALEVQITDTDGTVQVFSATVLPEAEWGTGCETECSISREEEWSLGGDVTVGGETFADARLASSCDGGFRLAGASSGVLWFD